MNKRPKITVVDYGVGNLYSLVNALKFCGAEVAAVEEPDLLEQAQALILPGVGSFEAGIRGLKLRGLVGKIKELAAKGKPMLGICLGAQLMLTTGHEFGIFTGLDIIKGRVVSFPVLAADERVPQIGWNKISPLKTDGWRHTIFDHFDIKSQVYFVHSYVLEPESQDNILAQTTYGGHTFCSAVQKGNIYGCQFHPEKSGPAGLNIITNFINLTKYGKI